jgi:hypothetical protein
MNRSGKKGDVVDKVDLRDQQWVKASIKLMKPISDENTKNEDPFNRLTLIAFIQL